jgi:hypothetical protein
MNINELAEPPTHKNLSPTMTRNPINLRSRGKHDRPGPGLSRLAAAAALFVALPAAAQQDQDEPDARPVFTFAPAETEAEQADSGEQDAGDSLAMKLSNPIASLISLPLQNNFDFGAGPGGDGFQYKLNLQPVAPFTLNENWNLISRTIVPFVYQENIFGKSTQSGLSDTVQSFFFSPKAPTAGGWIWGAGPVLLIPTATDDLLGAEKWGAGPTAVLLRQRGGWTYGGLVNHVWSYAGAGGRADVNATFLQPILTYTTKTYTIFGFNTEATYDWTGEQWVVPLNASVSQLLKLGKLPVQFTVGARYYAEKPTRGPDWGLRFAVTFLFPK